MSLATRQQFLTWPGSAVSPLPEDEVRRVFRDCWVRRRVVVRGAITTTDDDDIKAVKSQVRARPSTEKRWWFGVSTPFLTLA